MDSLSNLVYGFFSLLLGILRGGLWGSVPSPLAADISEDEGSIYIPLWT